MKVQSTTLPHHEKIYMANNNPITLDIFRIESDPPATVTYKTSQPTEQHELKDSSEISNLDRKVALDEIDFLDAQLLAYFGGKVYIEPALSRQIVSFQANKTRSAYRWYKYKEGFSASLVEYLLCKYEISSGKLLDPFAGSGTTLFATSASGINADGIELLSIGQQIVTTKLLLERTFIDQDFATLKHWQSSCPWKNTDRKASLTTVRITKGAYPAQTLDAIECYMGALEGENEGVQAVLRFALLCVLEAISYTRKDGQYLRWDYRSGRRPASKPFNKGPILDFEDAICSKLAEILHDVERGQPTNLFPSQPMCSDVKLFGGSCLDIMPTMEASSYDAILTSPPYCNRYDYTRTYALELALLGAGEAEIANLRQQMLSCTVENRAKNLLRINPAWANAIAATDSQELLQRILRYLEDEKAKGHLNNSGIPRMVRGYFYEMACIIADCSRVLKPNALLFMVNDNVRYSGASISVDLILSDIAEKLGFQVDNILVLPNGKGNSSQQMGEHGRDALRKCVYVWRKQ